MNGDDPSELPWHRFDPMPMNPDFSLPASDLLRELLALKYVLSEHSVNIKTPPWSLSQFWTPNSRCQFLLPVTAHTMTWGGGCGGASIVPVNASKARAASTWFLCSRISSEGFIPCTQIILDLGTLGSHILYDLLERNMMPKWVIDWIGGQFRMSHELKGNALTHEDVLGM